MSEQGSTSQAFFEAMYRRDADPWQFASSDYEQQRYAAILHALVGRRYSSAFEPGCSIGVLTESLAGMCDTVEAIELSPTAAARAVERCAAMPNVTIRCASLAKYAPAPCDLLVFCEIGYYFSSVALHQVLTRCVAALRVGGTLLAAHWLGASDDHLLSGDAVHAVIGTLPELQLKHAERQRDFRLDRWRKALEIAS